MFLYACVLTVAFKAEFSDIQDLITLQSNPFALLANPERQFLHGSIANILVGWLIGATSAESIKTYYSVLAVLSVLVFLYYARQRYRSPEHFKLFVLLIFSFPILHVTVTWLGKSDPLLWIGATIVFFDKDIRIRCLGYLLMILAHKEIGLFVSLFSILLSQHDNKREIITLAFAVIIGLFAHWLYLQNLSGKPFSRLDFALSHQAMIFKMFLERAAYNIYSIIVPFFAIVWLRRWRIDPRQTAIFLVCTLIAFGTADFTRVFTLLALPAAYALADKIIKTQATASIPYWLWAAPLLTASGMGRDIITQIGKSLPH